ncbi:FecR/PupR family sigma factor regulator [Steroidobacter sp.]|uniref:FecR/PupR family sigma factor regulator n=1 Tax=Steroidobacter sp. TaxID=1978227 RepID=UPI0039C99A44
MESSVDRKELQQINEQAALWMLRKEEGPLTPAQLRRYQAWCRRPHRAEALRRMEAFNKRLSQPWCRRRLAIRSVS